MKILLHSSKTMMPTVTAVHSLTTPCFMAQAAELHDRLNVMDTEALEQLMAIKPALAQTVSAQLEAWSDNTLGTAAALTFRGDIYSGLSAGQWSEQDAVFAQKHLFILSGLYGILRPFDAIRPYRLEMGYKLPLGDTVTLDKYWAGQLAGTLDPTDTYVNLTANEYFKATKPQLHESTVISPKFLTISPKTGQPVFVTVHAKIARGSFANWLITHQIDDPAKIPDYRELGYEYDTALSTPAEPAFVCREFGGLGLSVRLK